MRIPVHAVAGNRRLRKHVRRRGIQRLLILFTGDELVLVHAPEHIVRPVIGHRSVIPVFALPGIQVPPRVIVIGVIGGAGQDRAFPQGQFPKVLAEIALGSHLHAVIILAQVDRVQVALQDLILGIPVFQLQRQVSLLDFPLVALFRRKQRVFDQLLGDCGTALCTGRSQVGNKGTDDALQVYAAVGIETCILHRDERVAQPLRHGAQGNQHTVFRAFVFGDQVVVGIINKGGLCLTVQGNQVQLRRRINIALGDPRQGTEPGHAGQGRKHGQDPDRIQQHADNKVRFPGFRPENTPRFRFFLRFFNIFIIVIHGPG